MRLVSISSENWRWTLAWAAPLEGTDPGLSGSAGSAGRAGRAIELEAIL